MLITALFLVIFMMQNVLSLSSDSYQQRVISSFDNDNGNNTTSLFEKNYKIRMRRPVPCEKSVQYSGYVDNLETGEHIFFLFQESRLAPKTDPILLFLNGQLGCSTITNAWLETGLCLVKNTETETNPFSFNNVASILYIDEPSDVGFSYTEGKRRVSTTLEVTENIYWFLQAFFTEFHQYSKNDFHIAGASYGSHFVPSLATRIIRENRYALSRNLIPIQLVSVIIGNGYIQPRAHQLSYADYACGHHLDNQPLIFEKSTCQKMMYQRRHCERLLKNCRYSCTAAWMYCQKALVNPFYEKTKLNPFDIRKECMHNEDVDSCYPVIKDIVRYANRQDTKREFGVDYGAGEFLNCNKHVETRFQYTQDYLVDSVLDIEKLLAAQVRVLVYAGDMNWYNNWVGQLAWLSNLDWIGQVQFNEAQSKDWYSYVSGQRAGTVQSFLNLAFVKVIDAGQYAILDQPANMIDLYSRWLINISLSN